MRTAARYHSLQQSGEGETWLFPRLRWGVEGGNEQTCESSRCRPAVYLLRDGTGSSGEHVVGVRTD